MFLKVDYGDESFKSSASDFHSLNWVMEYNILVKYLFDYVKGTVIFLVFLKG